MESILRLLEAAKENAFGGRYIDIALGKYKFPETAAEGYELLKKELWQRK